MIQHFFLHGKHYGTAERSRETIHRQQFPPRGDAFFCPSCASLWAICPIEGAETMVNTAGCEQHPLWSDLPGGSLWLAEPSMKSDFNRAIPRELLAREVMLYLSMYDKEIQ